MVEITEEHIRQARDMALTMHHRMHKVVDIDDLVSDAMLGLVKAAHSYDGSRGVPFILYVKVRVRGAMLDGARKRDMRPRAAIEAGDVVSFVSLSPNNDEEQREGFIDPLDIEDMAPSVTDRMIADEFVQSHLPKLLERLFDIGLSPLQREVILGTLNEDEDSVSASRLGMSVDIFRNLRELCYEHLKESICQ